MKEGKSTLVGHPTGDTLYLTIPSRVATDSMFPFKRGDIVKIRIVQGYLVVESE